MARHVKDAKLDSRQARKALPARGTPYFRELLPGLHIGWRRNKAADQNAWLGRMYEVGQGYTHARLGTADDAYEADGDTVLDYPQAVEKALAWHTARKQPATDADAPVVVADYTVAHCLADYQPRTNKSAADTKWRIEAHILPYFRNLPCRDLTTKRLEKWRDDLAAQSPRLRTGKDQEQRHQTVAPADPANALRQRQASVNRTWTVFRAALNQAYRAGHIASDDAWRRVRPFGDVDVARVAVFSLEQVQRLLAVAAPDFRNLARAALETGCRFGELRALLVGDFDPRSGGTVRVRRSKSGNTRDVRLTEDGAAYFAALCAGRPGDEVMLLRDGNRAWIKDAQIVPMREACLAAKIKPLGFHAFRHTWATLALENGVTPLVVSKNLGHTTTKMVEKHYGNLTDRYLADAIRANGPRFGTPAKVVAVA